MSISLIDGLIDNLFNKKNIETTQIDKSQIPANSFGVFVTIKRSDKQKLNEYPFDIHGCIGYWNSNYKIIDKQTLIEKTFSVGNSAFYNDSRRNYFNSNAESDLDTKIIITFMLTPVYSISDGMMLIENKLTSFDNEIYGLIVEDKISGNRATYLPKVFSDKSWDYIKSSLEKKAGISESKYLLQRIEFYAYETIIIQKTLQNIYKKDGGYIDNSDIIKTNFGKFLNNYYKKFEFIPYQVIQNQIIIDKNQYVRNIATLTDCLNLVQNLNDETKEFIKKNLDYYIEIYLKNNKLLRQASGFLALGLNKLDQENKTNIYSKLINKIINNLYVEVENDNLEFVFELGEVLMALSILEPRPEILDRQILKLKSIIDNSNGINNIFQINWICKFIQAFGTSQFIDSGLFEIIYNQVLIIIPKINSLYETNYLAVSLECITCLYLYILDKEVNIDSDFFLSNISRIFDILQTRYNNEYGLYEFTDGTMRVDITGHILNALEYNKKIIIYEYKLKYIKYKKKYITLKNNS
jgi:AMMECR1 domain-containing protein